jgi:predicted metal-dependent HD superfamily phosphohydrolase
VKLNDDSTGQIVSDYILATKTHTTSGVSSGDIRSDLEWFLDIDLAVLAFHPLGTTCTPYHEPRMCFPHHISICVAFEWMSRL